MALTLRLADMLFNQPLLATETLATHVAAYLKARMFGDLADPNLAVNFNKPQGDASQYLRVSEGTAVLPVMGGLTHRPMLMDALCTGGLSSYSGLMKAFDEAMADESVEKIIMHVDSGGGQATGCFDLAYHIMANRGNKPIIAYVDGMACSAAYALACAADEVIASPHADVGSIGVIMMHEDYSKMLAKEGISVTTLKAGANKGMGSPYAPLSKEAKETMQARIDDLYEDFTGLVANARSAHMSQQDAKETEASVYNAQDALQIGLIDQIMTPDEFLAYITPSTPSASVAQKPVAAQAEDLSNQETEMNEQDLKELNELRAFKAAAEAKAAEQQLQSAIEGIQPQATALGFDATTAVSMMSNLSAEHKTFFMSVVDGAFAKLSEVNKQMATMQETHQKELAETQKAATTAVEESAAMQELGGSGDAAADENAERNNTTDDVRAKALAAAMKDMIDSGKFA